MWPLLLPYFLLKANSVIIVVVVVLKIMLMLITKVLMKTLGMMTMV